MRRHFVSAVVCLFSNALESVRKICRVHGNSLRRAHIGLTLGTLVSTQD